MQITEYEWISGNGYTYYITKQDLLCITAAVSKMYDNSTKRKVKKYIPINHNYRCTNNNTVTWYMHQQMIFQTQCLWENTMFLRTVCLSFWNYLAVQQSEHETQSGQFTLFWFAAWNINTSKPTGYVIHQQFNIQWLYALPTLYLCVLYLSENNQWLVPLTA